MSSINNISKEIAKALSEYTSDVEKGLEKAKDVTSKEAVKKLKNTSPKETGSYRKGWRVTKEGSLRILHNKTDYQLTHLLEYGHVNRDGGRTIAIPHIKKVEEEAVGNYIKFVEGIV